MSKQGKVLKMSKQEEVPEDVLKLEPSERVSCLDQHIPNRVCAAWVRLPGIKGKWECKQQQELGRKDFTVGVDEYEVWCICRAVEHGRKVAMRWLIEFVGIGGTSKKGKKLRRPKRWDNDVSIQSFGDKGIDPSLSVRLDSPEALFLNDVWEACSKSSVHFTYRTNHSPEDPATLAKGFSIVVEHIQAKLYEPEGKRLIEIAKSQK
jgi:hypothetical protein